MRQIKLVSIQAFIFGLLALLAMQNVAADSPGATAYAAEDYKKAFKLLTAEAKKGDGEAQYLLGTLYFDGLGVKPSAPKAVIWLKRAADNRHAMAAHMLGKLYMSGTGIPIDVEKGIHYMELADQLTPDEEEEECD